MIFDNFGNITNDDGSMINQPLAGALADLANNTATPDLVAGGASRNFITGQSGWQIKPDGSFEFGSGSFRGTITIGSGASVYIDGVNGRIILNDGVTNRAVWGNV